jgi:signal transduction histidine kinase
MAKRELPLLIVDENPTGLHGWMLDMTTYLTLAGGYLVAILTAGHLTLLGFTLLSAGNLVWAYCFHRLSHVESDALLVGLTAALIVLTLLLLELPRMGIGFDWLLPIITICIIGVIYAPRISISLSVAIWLGVTLVLWTLDNGHNMRDFVQTQLTLLPAAIFAFVFVFLLRQQYAQRKRAEALVAQLEAAQQQLRRYAGEVEELTITRERNSMAREIHDTLGHYLTILAVKLETATKLDEHGDPRLREELQEARRVAGECLLEVRRSVAALRPTSLSSLRLDEALARLVAEFEATTPATQVTLDAEGDLQALTPELRLALYRSAQESLTNIRKHAQATKVLLRVRVEGARAELLVRDNGIGAANDGHEPGFGLLGMRERIALLSGTVSAGPDPERGWRVEVSFPLPEQPVEPAPEATPDVSRDATNQDSQDNQDNQGIAAGGRDCFHAEV